MAQKILQYKNEIENLSLKLDRQKTKSNSIYKAYIEQKSLQAESDQLYQESDRHSKMLAKLLFEKETEI